MIGFFLFTIAYFLLFPLTIINVFYVENRTGYFRETAKNLDVFANREFRAFWNKALIVNNGYPFGVQGETLSSVLGKNQLKGSLSRRGKFLVWFLNILEKDHCIKAIADENTYKMQTKLTEPTPKSNVILWQLGSFLYALVIFINENTVTIAELGLTEETERNIKVFGAVAYFLFTYFNFNKSTLKKT